MGSDRPEREAAPSPKRVVAALRPWVGTDDLSLPWWRRAALHGYWAALHPYRKACLLHWRTRNTAPLLVATYHRVADDRATPWTIPNATFARQIDWLLRNFELVSLDEGQRRLRDGNPTPVASITFDDGYAENCDSALPLLIEKRIPFTYFVTSGYLTRGAERGRSAAAAGLVPGNTVEQIRMLAAAGVEIGGHTRTHADLGRVTDPDKVYEEVIGGAEDLASITGRPVRFFAFPFGHRQNLSALAFRVARRAGFAAVCSAYGGFNFPGKDAFHLQRFVVDDNLIRLKNWCGVDPRKLRIRPTSPGPRFTGPE